MGFWPKTQQQISYKLVKNVSQQDIKYKVVWSSRAPKSHFDTENINTSLLQRSVSYSSLDHKIAFSASRWMCQQIASHFEIRWVDSENSRIIFLTVLTLLWLGG